MLRDVILGLLLRTDAPAHGYQLMKEYKELSGVQIIPANFYRELEKLSEKKWIRPCDPENSEARQKRYEITEAGVTAFRSWLRSPKASAIGFYESELSSRAVFFDLATPDVALEIVDQCTYDLLHLSKLIQRDRSHALENHLAETGNSSKELVILLTRWLKHIEVELLFLAELRDVYEEPPPAGGPRTGGRRST